MAREVNLGYISGVYGVRGWLKVHSYTQPREAILNYRVWQLSEPSSGAAMSASGAVYEIVDGRLQGRGIVTQLAGVADRDAAAALIGYEIFVERAALPAAEDNEYYWSDLIGLAVINAAGERLGVVRSLLETGAHDVLVLEGGDNQLIPFVIPDVVRNVDLDAGVITVAWHASYWD